MKPYRTKNGLLAGSNWTEVYKNAQSIYKKICAHSKRRPYIRSAYFKKDKIFLGLFWSHLYEKNLRDRVRRLKYFSCGIELIQNSYLDPESRDHLNDASQIAHRFTGITPKKEIFRAQIKEDKRNRKKWLISIFPYEK
ncbi:hypothetical protein COY07_06330 [Candidatus Peregrinibacteria bacterium CG_4_10_14_0_2_um_filter_43_11]|nr:MAG: hypothetical protein COY07_06330 [Candidatus Peregrinibacteria bacterium CG_4_10_14_0_2_um_filter_43_11]